MWNARALLRHDGKRRRKKRAALSKITKRKCVIVPQEAHGSEEEAITMIHFIHRPYICCGSHLPSPAG